METVKDLIEKLEILPPDMPLEPAFGVAVHLIGGYLRVSCGTSPDNVNLLWLKDITPEMKSNIQQIWDAVSVREEADSRLRSILKNMKW